MELISFNEKNDKPICLALGYFDSVHNGHKTLLTACLQSGFVPAVFTFKNNPQSQISGNAKQCYTFEERVQIFDRLGMQIVINCIFDKHFMELTGAQFLDTLRANFNIKKVVFGTDYTCGYGAGFKAKEVKEYFERHNIAVQVVDLLTENGGKIASREIARMLGEGLIEDVNSKLPYPYFLIGKVVKGRKVGGSLVGYPTANVPYPENKVELKAGVYKTNIIVDGSTYLGLTNVGTHPTFNDYNFNIESFVIGFDGVLYGKNLKVEFIEYLRGVVKFESAEQLKNQIDSDFRRVIGKN